MLLPLKNVDCLRSQLMLVCFVKNSHFMDIYEKSFKLQQGCILTRKTSQEQEF